MEAMFLEALKISPMIAILGLMWWYQRKDYQKLVDDTQNNAKEREDKLHNTIEKLAEKFDIVEDIRTDIIDIKKRCNRN